MTTILRRALGALIGVLALAPAIAPSPASASSLATTNACRFSVDDYFRDIDVTLNGTATVLSDASGRYVNPTEVVPGLQVKLAGATVNASLPAWMPEYGYNTGLLKAGVNTIPTQVWVAVKATNTIEGTRTIGPLAVTATTTVTTDAGGHFVSATPISFTAPTLPDTTWTATGGDVALSQAGAGAITQKLPVGPGGTLQSVLGSFALVSDINGARFGLDCQPGVSTDAGATHAAATAAPFDTRSGPLDANCLSGLGRQISGTRADLPAGLNRELEPLAVRFDGSAAPTSYTPGAPLALKGASIRVTIPSAVARVLGRYIYSNNIPLAYADRTYPVVVWAAIRGTNTAEGVQTVRLDLTYRLHPLDSPLPASQGDIVSWAPVVLEGVMPTTTWTPTGAGPIAFSQAGAGQMDRITVIGKVEPAFNDYPYDVNPYGSVFVRASTERYGESLDCIPGAVTNIDTAVAWSNLGRGPSPFGSAGRYTIAENTSKPVFATATVAAVAPRGNSGSGAPSASTPPAAPVAPPPAAPAKPAAKLVSTSLSAKAGRLNVTVSCSPSGAACQGSISVKTALRVRIGRRRTVVTVVRSTRYSVTPGARKTLTLALSSDARRLLRQAGKRVLVKVTLAATGSRAVSSTMSLRG